ncbi:MAG: hypothetical protein AB1792_05375 [Candidatus Zixiibacteriota bacterium]
MTCRTLRLILACLAAPAVLPMPALGQGMHGSVPADSVIAGIRRTLTVCDSAWRELAYITVTRERKLDGEGRIEKETTYKSRVYVRHDDQREFLEAMWEDGQPVSDKKLRSEQDDRRKQQRKQLQERRKKKGEEREKGTFRMLDPFREDPVPDYDLTAISPDTLSGVPVWKVAVQPRRESEDLLAGMAWVTIDTYRAIAESYRLAKLPGGVKSMEMRFEYGEVIPQCAFPRHFLMRAHGRALLVIKFNMELDVQMDSVQIDPELPDSLFAMPED